MWGVRRGYVARRDWRSARWAEDLSFCLGAPWRLDVDAGVSLGGTSFWRLERGGKRRIGLMVAARTLF